MAAAIGDIGLILACLLPLVLCWYLLRPEKSEKGTDLVTNVLIEDLVADHPLLLPPQPKVPAIEYRGELEQPDQEEPDAPDE